MKTSFKEFARKMVADLQGDQEELQKHTLKAHARELIRKDDQERRLRRKAVKAARKKGRQ